MFTRVVRVVSFFVLFFFLWTFGGLFDIAYAVKYSDQRSAFSNQRKTKGQSPEEKLQKQLKEMEQILDDPDLNVCAKNEKLQEKKSEIDGFDKEIRVKFKETEKRLKNARLPQKILKRHYDFVEKYEDNLEELKNNLDAIGQARTIEGEKTALENAKKYIEKLNPPEKHKTLDPNKLPHRTVEPVFKEPRTKPEQFLKELSAEVQKLERAEVKMIQVFEPSDMIVASSGSLEELLSGEANKYESEEVTDFPAYDLSSFLLAAADPPTSDDLAETIEVRFTAAITVKAAELANDPLKIYEWVRNNIEFVPTYGSIQGADYCLQTKQCNAFDTASLLIALLRISNIHARYVEGTVEIPIEKVMNWLGRFSDANAALNLIASGGIPVTGLTSGGEIVMVRMEHAWVEAYVDYIPYRGAVIGDGDTWIPLDASYKQYDFANGLNTDSAVPIDFESLLAEVESQSMINSDIPSITGIPSGTIQNQISTFQSDLRDYMTNNFPEVDNYYELRNALHGYKSIIQKNMRYLPNSLEGKKVIARSNAFSEIPQNLRHTVNFNVNNFLDDDPLVYTASLSELAGKRITLSYAPAAPEDEQVMENAEGILNFPLYLVEVIPELKVEGQTVATGQNVTMGSEQIFNIIFSQPGGDINMANSIVQAGEYHAVGLNGNKVSFQYLYDRVNRWQPDTEADRDNRLGELLYLTSMFYFAKSDYFSNELARSSGIINLRQPSVCNVSMKLNANYVFGTPLSVSSVGLNMDAVHDVVLPVSKDNNNDRKVSFMIQSGLYSSGLEHFLFEYMMDFESVSAVKLLDLASQQNVPIYIIDSENSQRVDELNISIKDKQDIRNLVKLPAYKAGHQKNSFINDHAVCIPLFGKEGLG
ncbi:MAG: transglutaminase domain-containing protein, partial [Nitrospirota bacterium]